MPTDAELPRHHAYVLRFWETRSLPPDPASRWRFSLENLHGPGEHKFPDLETLTSFLQAEIGEVGNGRDLEKVVEAYTDAGVESEEKGEEPMITFDPAGLSILLVEEDDAIHRSVERWLAKTLPEATILGARDDDSAESVARSEGPEVILVDVAPPKADSADAVKRLRNAAPGAHIVALTMEEPKGRRDAVLEAGADACIRIWEMRQQLVPVLNELLVGDEETGKRTVVCIEDEIDMLSLIKFTLERHNIELVSVLGGEEGLQTVRKTKPDLILLDLMMPDVDGLEVYHRLRGDEQTKDIPVIVLTVLDPHWVESRGMDLTGIADYVTKPFVPQDLVQRVGRALEVVA
jgi:DNA-binding response OmpR family regulator